MGQKLYSVKYKNITVRLPVNPRKNKCECCGRTGKIDLHHTIYLYTVAQVRENPLLSADNSFSLCFPCHAMANNIRKILGNKALFRSIVYLFNLDKEFKDC